jgi:hypothetical protein
MRRKQRSRAMQAGWPMSSVLLGIMVAGCTSPVTLENLKMPSIVWERDRGLCGSGLAVDGDGELWAEEGGCEDGRPKLIARGHATPAKVDALRQAFDTLPKTGGPDRSSCNGNIDSFSERTEAGEVTSFVCASGTATDVTGLEEPYLTVAQLFLDLP